MLVPLILPARLRQVMRTGILPPQPAGMGVRVMRLLPRNHHHARGPALFLPSRNRRSSSDVEIDPQSCRFRRSQTHFALQAIVERSRR